MRLEISINRVWRKFHKYSFKSQYYQTRAWVLAVGPVELYLEVGNGIERQKTR